VVISENISNWVAAINQIILELSENGTVDMLSFTDDDISECAILLMSMVLNTGKKNGQFQED